MDFLEEMLKSKVKTGKFILTSGRESDFYIDVKSLMFNAKFINNVAHVMFNVINKRWGSNVDTVGGMELGSVPLSTAIAYRSYIYSAENSIDHFVVRKKLKEHGTKQLIEGFYNTIGKNIVLVDDVLTTGSSLMKSYKALKSSNRILGAVVVVNRQEMDLNDLPFKVISLYTKKELMKG